MKSYLPAINILRRLYIRILVFSTDSLSPSDCDCPVQCEKIKYGLQLSSAYFPSPHFWDALYKLFNQSDNGTATDVLQEIIRLDFPKNICFIEALLRGKRIQKILPCIRCQLQEFCKHKHHRKYLVKGGWGSYYLQFTLGGDSAQKGYITARVNVSYTY